MADKLIDGAAWGLDKHAGLNAAHDVSHRVALLVARPKGCAIEGLEGIDFPIPLDPGGHWWGVKLIVRPTDAWREVDEHGLTCRLFFDGVGRKVVLPWQTVGLIDPMDAGPERAAIYWEPTEEDMTWCEENLPRARPVFGVIEGGKE